MKSSKILNMQHLLNKLVVFRTWIYLWWNCQSLIWKELHRIWAGMGNIEEELVLLHWSIGGDDMPSVQSWVVLMLTDQKPAWFYQEVGSALLSAVICFSVKHRVFQARGCFHVTQLLSSCWRKIIMQTLFLPWDKLTTWKHAMLH